ncbi:MAG: cell division protein FtsL [Ruminiclostridium sp.]
MIELAATDKYVYGAVAENIKDNIYDPYEENEVLKSKKVARNNTKIKTKIIFYILVIFCMCAVTMFQFAQISQLNYQSSELNKQYVAIQNENNLLSIEIENAKSLINIREVAVNNLQMHKPYKSQIIYVNVPKEDVTMIASKEQPKATVVVKNVGNSIKKFLSMFY